MRFDLFIKADNYAMSTELHIADALLSVAGEIRKLAPVEGAEHGRSWKDNNIIRDVNGNTVGGWRLTR